jgi:hypothetical protein
MKYLSLPLSVSRLKRIHFQPLEDKVAGKLVPWIGKHVTMDGHATLVEAVLTSMVLYYITVLEIPVEVLMKIDSIRHTLLWAACDKVTGGKCKVIWDFCVHSQRQRWTWDPQSLKICIGAPTKMALT